MSARLRRGAWGRRILAWLAPLLAIGAACRPPVSIVSPASGSERTWMPLDAIVDVQAGADVSTFTVKLNGHDVTSRFALGPPVNGVRRAVATDLWDGLVLPGPNVLEARIRIPGGAFASSKRTFQTVGDPYADAVFAYQVGPFGGFPSPSFLPGIVLGPPRGSGVLDGGFDVFSLGFGGWIVLLFVDNVIVDGDGVDFTVFENAFFAENPATLTLERPFADPGIVGVSQDGVTWHEFPCLLATFPAAGIYYPGCAGVYPVLSHADRPATPHASIPSPTPLHALIGQSSEPLPAVAGAGGDSFDLADVGLAWARFVRIRDPNHATGDPFGPTNAGFDLDAVAAIHSAPATDANRNGVPDAVE